MKWLNEPASWQRTGDVLSVSVDPGTDFWRETGYGYIHDSGHVYGEEHEGDVDVSVRVRGAFGSPYDQAGVMLRIEERVWLKTGVEFFEGRPRLSTVLTLGRSSWTVTDLPEWMEEITLRASRRGDAVEVRYLVAGGPPELAALVYLPPGRGVLAGIMCAAPEGPGFRVNFSDLLIERGWSARLARMAAQRREQAEVHGFSDAAAEGPGDAATETGQEAGEGPGGPASQFGETALEGFGETGLEGFGETGLEGLGETGLDGLGETGLERLGETGLEGLGETGLEGLGETGLDGLGETAPDGRGETAPDGRGEPSADALGEGSAELFTEPSASEHGGEPADRLAGPAAEPFAEPEADQRGEHPAVGAKGPVGEPGDPDSVGWAAAPPSDTDPHLVGEDRHGAGESSRWLSEDRDVATNGSRWADSSGWDGEASRWAGDGARWTGEPARNDSADWAPALPDDPDPRWSSLSGPANRSGWFGETGPGRQTRWLGGSGDDAETRWFGEIPSDTADSVGSGKPADDGEPASGTEPVPSQAERGAGPAAEGGAGPAAERGAGPAAERGAGPAAEPGAESADEPVSETADDLEPLPPGGSPRAQVTAPVNGARADQPDLTLDSSDDSTLKWLAELRDDSHPLWPKPPSNDSGALGPSQPSGSGAQWPSQPSDEAGATSPKPATSEPLWPKLAGNDSGPLWPSAPEDDSLSSVTSQTPADGPAWPKSRVKDAAADWDRLAAGSKAGTWVPATTPDVGDRWPGPPLLDIAARERETPEPQPAPPVEAPRSWEQPGGPTSRETPPAGNAEPAAGGRQTGSRSHPPIDLPPPPDPADEWISLLTADPAEE